mmetsp:Transcript_17127/g.42280  ORF Transcript_17127/g.42280 Transcript_17127/m.42280 type:complete len:232 (+) Transcript_17127:1786-2481(+)
MRSKAWCRGLVLQLSRGILGCDGAGARFGVLRALAVWSWPSFRPDLVCNDPEQASLVSRVKVLPHLPYHHASQPCRPGHPDFTPDGVRAVEEVPGDLVPPAWTNRNACIARIRPLLSCSNASANSDLRMLLGQIFERFPVPGADVAAVEGQAEGDDGAGERGRRVPSVFQSGRGELQRGVLPRLVVRHGVYVVDVPVDPPAGQYALLSSIRIVSHRRHQPPGMESLFGRSE